MMSRRSSAYAHLVSIRGYIYLLLHDQCALIRAENNALEMPISTPTTFDYILALPYCIFWKIKTSFVEKYPPRPH